MRTSRRVFALCNCILRGRHEATGLVTRRILSTGGPQWTAALGACYGRSRGRRKVSGPRAGGAGAGRRGVYLRLGRGRGAGWTGWVVREHPQRVLCVRSLMRRVLALLSGCALASCALAQPDSADTAAILRRLAALEEELATLKALVSDGDSSRGAGAGGVARRVAPPAAPLGRVECFNDRGTDCPIQPPLDSAVIWSKQHDEDGTPPSHSCAPSPTHLCVARSLWLTLSRAGQARTAHTRSSPSSRTRRRTNPSLGRCTCSSRPPTRWATRSARMCA